MAGLSSDVIVQCRTALQLTQQEFGDLVGRDKRTIQRWEQHGVTLIASETETLARALYPSQPDLAEQIAVAGNTTIERLGLLPGAHLVRDDVDSIVRAAADAIGVAPDAIRSAVAAAFARARDAGLDAATVAEELTR